MRKILLILFAFWLIPGFAQNISVSSFKSLDTDLTANTAGTMEKDQNGETAALIKVVTTQTGFTFDGGALGIVKTKQTPGEIWVYIPRGSKKITIKHPQLGVLRDYFFPIAIESARTYEMVLIAGEVQTVVKQARTSQYVVFQLMPPDAVVELDGELLKTEGGVASKMMKFGTYNYRVQAPNYLLEAGSVTVDDPNNKKVVNISLKPNFAKVTINVDNNAEIWVNGEKKGEGSWSGNLGAGTYELEAKKEGHRSTTITQDFIVTAEPQIVKLQTPTPIYGEADINSSPGMADIFIDGKKVGQTPLLLSDLLVGLHTISIIKEGYESENKTITIKEGEPQSYSFQLNEIKVKNESFVHDINSNTPSSNQNDYPEKSDEKILNSILKANNYTQAASLLNNNLSHLTIKDRATAYNKLVDLAMADFDAQNAIVTENQVNKQMGKEEKPVDMNVMNTAAYNALCAAMECDKYDQQPNEKGKVKPAFAEKNAARIWNSARNALLNAGQDAVSASDYTTARKYWQTFVLSDAEPLFAKCERTEQLKEVFGQVARISAVLAYQDKDMDMANKLCDIAMKDPQEYENALNLKLEILGDGLKTRDDSLSYCNKLKDIYAEHKTDGVMEKLFNTLSGLGEKDAAFKILDDALAANPDNFVALFDKGNALLQDQKVEQAVECLKKAADLKTDNAMIAAYAGHAFAVYAQTIEDPAKKKDLYKQAIDYLDKAKELDPDRMQSNWGYSRYNAYYNYYGEDAPETKQAEADSK